MLGDTITKRSRPIQKRKTHLSELVREGGRSPGAAIHLPWQSRAASVSAAQGHALSLVAYYQNAPQGPVWTPA